MSRPKHIPAIIGLFFGGLWGVSAALSLQPGWRIPIVLVVAIIIILLIFNLSRRNVLPGEANKNLFGRNYYLLAVGLELLAIYVASVLLPRLGLQQYLIEVIGVIVGLHFIGHWKATKSTLFLKIAAGMCMFSILGAAFPYTYKLIHLRDFVASSGNALILLYYAGGKIRN
ncbi:MAG: hypothetical protein ABI168_05390 [Ginsengibacter sp.]